MPNPTRRRWFLRVEWKPQDCWVGVFWKPLYDHWSYWPEGTPARRPSDPKYPNRRWVRTNLDIWICLLPMVPIHLGWKRTFREMSHLSPRPESVSSGRSERTCT